MVVVGFIGLGQMGRPMVLNLAKGPDDLIVCARRTEALAGFSERGVRTTNDVRDLACADVLFLCLPDGEAVHDVLLGATGVGRELREGSIVVDTSTISHKATLETADALKARGVAFVDAPVSGMQSRAEAGTLTIMCGGSPDVIARIEPLLRRMGDNILHMGETGAGQLAKLINQLLFDINAAALAEILPMASRMGLDAQKVAAIVNSGTGRSYASEFFLPRILKGSFHDGYPMKHAYKDLVSGAEISAAQGIPLPVLAAATATYQQALLRGYGDLDKGGMIRVFEDLLGVAFRARLLNQDETP